MNEIRCGQCKRKLAEGVFLRLTIKCVRCSTLNHFTEGHEPHPPRAPGASSNGPNHERRLRPLPATQGPPTDPVDRR
ncbi:Com family DNA-binding transcriptional regulator [Hydrogenophaga sp.]|uniref:Com family DNA-binding transcriptional regulator n=1 Tax=Hydrogenophaga sp. TaxID=1904254 RepID=UPI003F719444